MASWCRHGTSTFLPRFVTDASHCTQQITVLSLLFLVLALLRGSCYVILAGQLRDFIRVHSGSRIQNGISGTLYLVAGALLAGIRSPQ